MLNSLHYLGVVLSSSVPPSHQRRNQPGAPISPISVLTRVIKHHGPRQITCTDTVQDTCPECERLSVVVRRWIT